MDNFYDESKRWDNEEKFPDDSFPISGEDFKQTYYTLEETIARTPNVKIKKPPTLQDIYERYGLAWDETNTEHTELKEIIFTHFRGFEKSQRKAESYPPDDWFPFIDNLYGIYLLSSNEDMPAWIKAFSNFDLMWDMIFVDDFSHIAKTHIIGHIRAFNQSVIHQPKFKEVYPRLFRTEWSFVYESDEEWIPLPPDNRIGYTSEGKYSYTTRSVLEELKEFDGAILGIRGFNHTTGSPALDGIAEHGAILSADEALKRNIKIKTGEYISYARGHIDSPDQRRTLRDIYTNNGPMPISGYSFYRWFNEFPVSFVINKQRHSEYLTANSLDTFEMLGKRLPTIFNQGSEGVSIGHIVELASVDAIFCPKKYKSEMKEWCKANAPHIKVVSLEVIEMYILYINTLEKIAKARNMTVTDVIDYIISLSSES